MPGSSSSRCSSGHWRARDRSTRPTTSTKARGVGVERRRPHETQHRSFAGTQHSSYSLETLRGMLKVATRVADRAHAAVLPARQR